MLTACKWQLLYRWLKGKAADLKEQFTPMMKSQLWSPHYRADEKTGCLIRIAVFSETTEVAWDTKWLRNSSSSIVQAYRGLQKMSSKPFLSQIPENSHKAKCISMYPIWSGRTSSTNKKLITSFQISFQSRDLWQCCSQEHLNWNQIVNRNRDYQVWDKNFLGLETEAGTRPERVPHNKSW